MTRCFFVKPSGNVRRSLRRYWGEGCSGPYSFHNAHHLIGVFPEKVNEEGRRVAGAEIDQYAGDPNWPTRCDGCGADVPESAERQIFEDRVYVDDSGREYSLRDKVPGMMWDASWSPDCWKGPDGMCLVVVCPNGREWMIDGQASNCTNKDDQGPFGVAHRCWVRHGTPPNITVDKNGLTCAAGAGSIQAGDYHGFLRDGVFT